MGAEPFIDAFKGKFLDSLKRALKKQNELSLFNHTVKRNLKLKFAEPEKPTIDVIIKQKQPPETPLERFERLTGINPCKCPVCKSGLMVRVRELPRIRSPAWFTPGQYLVHS
jgi:hypothetical protein